MTIALVGLLERVGPGRRRRVRVVLLVRVADLLGDGELDLLALGLVDVEGALVQPLVPLDELGDGRAEHLLLLPAAGLGGGDALDAAVLLHLGHVDADGHVHLLQVGNVVTVLFKKKKEKEA